MATSLFPAVETVAKIGKLPEARPGGLFRYVCGTENVSSPAGSITVLAVVPSPQLMTTVFACVPPGLTIVPLTVSTPFSSIEDRDRTNPGAANVGAGLAMLTTTCAYAVSLCWSLKVTPIT